MVQAVSGLLGGSAAVRACCLAALPAVPALAEGVAPDSQEVLAVLALARRDVNDDNAAAAEALWEQVGDVWATCLLTDCWLLMAAVCVWCVFMPALPVLTLA
jgi:hypothetical protein